MKILKILVVLLLLSACEDVIDLDVESREPELVINGRICSGESKCQIVLSTTMEFYASREPNYIKSAQLSLLENGKFIDSLIYNNKTNSYQTKSEFNPILGANYSIDIYYQNKHYRATDKLRNRPNNLEYLGIKKTPIFGSSIIFTVYGKDEPGIGDYYYWRLLRNGREMRNIAIIEDKFIDGNEFSPFYIGNEDEYFIKDGIYEKRKLVNGDLLILEQMIITSQTYKFLFDLNVQIQNSIGMTFSTAPAGVNSNLTQLDINGEVINQGKSHGLFYCANIQRDTVIVLFKK